MGRAEDRVSHGRLGPKGLHGWMANSSKDRLTKPLIKKNGKFTECHSHIMLLEKAARALRDRDLLSRCSYALELCKRQESYLKTQLQYRAANVLSVKW